jgi:hypothetical protein
MAFEMASSQSKLENWIKKDGLFKNSQNHLKFKIK